MSIWMDAAMKVYDLADEATLWKRLRSFLRRRKVILVLGASGAGKTQLIQTLANPLSIPSFGYQRTVSAQNRRLAVDEYPFLLIDTPGQRMDKAVRFRALTAALADKVEGIINVVSFGYHEGEGPKANAVPGSAGNIAKADFLKERRQIELDLLSEWVPLVDSTISRWILTVVTKADLWWPQQERVSKFYSEQHYADRMSSLAPLHSIIPYCSIIEPFFGTRTSGTFGDRERAGLRANLRESLIRLTGANR